MMNKHGPAPEILVLMVWVSSPRFKHVQSRQSFSFSNAQSMEVDEIQSNIESLISTR